MSFNNPIENQERATGSIRGKKSKYVKHASLNKQTAAIIYKEGCPRVRENNRLDRLMKPFHLVSILNKYYDPFE